MHRLGNAADLGIGIAIDLHDSTANATLIAGQNTTGMLIGFPRRLLRLQRTFLLKRLLKHFQCLLLNLGKHSTRYGHTDGIAHRR